MCSLLLLLVVAPAAALRGAPLRATTRLDYDHLYHIGSPVDVFKHCVLTALLRRCTAKASPLTYAETHAGRGLYAFGSEEASMLAEYEDGYHKLRARAAGRARLGARGWGAFCTHKLFGKLFDAQTVCSKYFCTRKQFGKLNMHSK